MNNMFKRSNTTIFSSVMANDLGTQHRPVGSKFQLVRRVVVLSNKASEAPSLGGSGGMPPQEKFGILDHLRSLLVQFLG